MGINVNNYIGGINATTTASLPSPFYGLPSRITKADLQNQKTTVWTNPYLSSVPPLMFLNHYIVLAALAYENELDEKYGAALVQMTGNVGDTGFWFAAEAEDPEDDTYRIIADAKEKSDRISVHASIVKEETLPDGKKQYRTFSPILMSDVATSASDSSDVDMAAINYVLIAMAVAINPAFERVFSEVRTICKETVKMGQLYVDEKKYAAIYVASSMLQSLIEGKDSHFFIAEPRSKANNVCIDNLSKDIVLRSQFNSGVEVFGKPRALYVGQEKTKKPGVLTFENAMQEFADYRSKKHWTEAEERLIPTFPPDYPVMPEAVKLARRYISTKEDRRPMVNFMWRGITSYGKSTGVEMLAAFLHTPLLRMTCSSTMETQDFLSTFVPDNDDQPALGALPQVSVEEMFCDAQSAYKKLTGIDDPDATDEACLKVMLAAAAANARGGSARFKHIESNFVKAMEHGYICEIQEASRVKDAGVLVGLNEYDRPGAIIPLVDGGFTTRHPDAICIYTDNVGYNSCRPLDPSVLRRFSVIIDSNKMTKEQVINRVVYNTGFEKKGMLEQMYTVWKDIADYCISHEFTDGSVSVTELEMWAKCVKLDGYDNLEEDAIECVISKATAIPEEQEELKQLLNV